MANINVVVEKPIADGYKLKFRTPCDSTTIEGLEVKYPAKNGVGTLIKKFVFKDAHGTELSGVGNLFVSGVMIEVLLDVTHNEAYIQNADTNSYVESVKGEIKRLEESQKQFLAVAGKAVERCENIADSADGFEQAIADAAERAESVKGVYFGSGDMPEGYNIQVDSSGEAYTMDTILDEESQNPVTNAAIAKQFSEMMETVANTVAELRGTITANKAELDAKVSTNQEAIAKIPKEYARNGFGLGTNRPEKIVYTQAELDALTATGWYGLDIREWSSEDRYDVFGVYFQHAVVHVVAIDAYTFYQELYIHPASSQCVQRRWYYKETGFSAWELKYPIAETGEWTPRLLTANGSNLSCTYEQQAGMYSRVGDLVFVFGRICFNNCEREQLARVSLPFAEKKVSGGGSPALTIHKAVNCFAENGVCKELSLSSLASDAQGSAVPVTASYGFLKWLGGSSGQEFMFSGTYIVEV